MTSKQYWLLCILAGVCVLLALERFRVTRNLNQKAQESVQQYTNQVQTYIDNLDKKYGPNLRVMVDEMKDMSTTNGYIRQILMQAGVTPLPAWQSAGTNLSRAGATNSLSVVTNLGPTIVGTNLNLTVPTNSATATTNPPAH